MSDVTLRGIGETYPPMGLFVLLWLNLRVRWREWRIGEAEGVFLQQMRGLWAAEVIRPRPRGSRNLLLVRSSPSKTRRPLRRLA